MTSFEVPQLEKVWNISDFLRKSIPHGSEDSMHKVLMKKTIYFLMTASSFPFNLYYSCNGSSFGIAGDGVDYLDLGSPLNKDIFASVSWVVLQGNGGFKNHQLMVTLEGSRIRIYFSENDNYVGGNTTTVPTTTIGGNRGVELIEMIGNQSYEVSDLCLWMTQEADVLRGVHARSTEDKGIFVFGLEKIKVSKENARDVFVNYTLFEPNFRDFKVSSNFFNKHTQTRNAEELLPMKIGYTPSSITMEPIYGYRQFSKSIAKESFYGMYPIMLVKDSNSEFVRGYFGVMFDFFLASAYMPYFSKVQNGNYAFIGNVVWPWYKDGDYIF